ncbi:MAG: BREX system P-loop protein BrxC [Methylococcales bacterium]|nr:BREX system P-loop protein BrxC [Methylococcales bacterium]
MSKINEILTLNLQEDIKSVIDLQDHSELEIQQEIESYIVTEGIGRHLYSFTNQYTSNIKETGVWISGFYGSGKSYFGKMLGYIIDNSMINGTPARERFIPRLKGVTDESLIENAIHKLDAIKSRVVFLDIAKQNTDSGLAFTLFANLLKNLGFRDDVYGYMEFDFYIEGKYDELKRKAKELEGKEWNELKTSNKQVAAVMRNVLIAMGDSEASYTDIKDTYDYAIRNFSISKFKEELEKYLKFQSDETLVFVLDEASEAISQKKFTLLDLEGISEALSSISRKVWTIAIAQEKLDDVINNANVNRSQLTKVTDRFKTKIHLESTEVDVIIRSRLLQKKEHYFQQLLDYYKTNEGLVSDATNLKSSFPTKTTTAEEFAIYYPFHKYQFQILQQFLFSSNALVATQIAARGMIITAFDVLRKQMREQSLFSFVTGYAICTEAQTAPPVGLVNKYDTATKILSESKSTIEGEKLLKTIHLLADSEVVSPTVENITKSYISDLNNYYDTKPKIEAALSLLVEAKVLLLSNNNYKITSDLEGKLLEEMKGFEVELYSKKRSLINTLKDYKTFTPVATFNDGSECFKFSVLSDQDDELASSGSKQLKLTVYSLFNIEGNRQDFIEDIKLKTQSDKDLISLIPDNSEFTQIEKWIVEVMRYSYIEQKYANETEANKRQIIRDFLSMREEMAKHLRNSIEKAYKNAALIYLFDEHLLNADTFKSTISDIQKKLVKNIYTKRLTAQLSESLIPKIFSSRKEDLSRLFSGNDFNFFDANGNFTGDHLKVVEEINAKIKTKFVDGKSLEADLSGAPWGYTFGTLVSTLAALLRAGRVSVKYNGDTYFSHEQKTIHEAFTNTTKFKAAAFKSISATLTTAQKNRAVQLLLDLDIQNHTQRKVDWNINDFNLADSIRVLAEHFIGALTTLNDSVEHFDTLFPTMTAQKTALLNYSGKVTESNYIEKVNYLLSNEEDFKTAIQAILKTQKFVKKNLSEAKDKKHFIENVTAELKKANRTDNTISDASAEFQRLYHQDMVKNFAQLQQQAQIIKDSYFKLLKNAATGMSYSYTVLQGKVDAALHTLKTYPPELNTHTQKLLTELKNYCAARIIAEPSLEFSISCKNCGYSLSDILNYIDLAPSKGNDLLILENSFIAEPAKDNAVQEQLRLPRKIKLQIPSKTMTVQEYKNLLTTQLSALASARLDEQIELDINIHE